MLLCQLFSHFYIADNTWVSLKFSFGIAVWSNFWRRVKQYEIRKKHAVQVLSNCSCSWFTFFGWFFFCRYILYILNSLIRRTKYIHSIPIQLFSHSVLHRNCVTQRTQKKTKLNETSIRRTAMCNSSIVFCVLRSGVKEP